MGKFQHKVQIIPLGGLGEIGKNMTVFRYGDDMILVDAGLMFPEDDMLGIDLVIPDITYLVENQDKMKGIFLTHGHEDHIGALPYVMKQIDCPVYGTALTLGILQGRLKENGVSSNNLHVVKPGDKVNAGAFKLDFIRVNHSIPDAVSIAINTPIGTIIHTGDFKIDHTPVDGQVTQFNKFAEYGDRGVLALLADSTNAERPGFTPSEKMVGQTFDDEFRYAKHRIIIATFSSNVHRIQQVVDTAVKYDRKVAVIGRSMVNVVSIAKELGYLKAPDGVLIDIDDAHNYSPEKIVIITTGSQGEPMSALTRMAMNDHKKVDIMPGDTVIISATPIPGNEKLVSRTIDHLYKLGADVIYEKSNGVHVSGHASQEEIKLMHNLVRPKFFIPVHGEYRHLIKHANLAQSLGMPIHTGDFKIDHTPVDGQVTQFNKFAEYGDRGVLALLADSTNAERPGFTPSEKMVGQTFDDEFRYAKHRIIIATFSSNVHRIQQVVDTAVKYDRKVAVIGRSMVNVVSIAKELGYLKAPDGVLIDIDDAHNYSPEKIVIITTGSQGEPMSALTRMAMNDHKKVDIMPGDTVIISATPIPGNEKLVSRTIDHLYKLGADVIYEKSNGVHVSGHASQEEIKLMHNLVRPKFFIPVHGEYRHLIKHANLAQSLGMPKENIVIAENGSVIELTKNSININGKVPSGKVLVDGLGVGDVGNIVLRDRRQLSQDGIMIVVVTIDKESCHVVSGPDIVSRGFVYVREAEGLMDEARERVQSALERCEENGVSEWSAIKSTVRDSLGRFLYERTRRRPMILPIIMEI